MQNKTSSKKQNKNVKTIYYADCPNPKNQWALVIYLLLENYTRGMNMAIAMRDNFHKFQSRLLEVEKSHPKLKIDRKDISRKNRFGHPSFYRRYKPLSHRRYLVNLLKKVNRQGLKP